MLRYIADAMGRHPGYVILVTCMAILIALIGWCSLGWPWGADTQAFLYMAYLMDAYGYRPYTDFFDIQTPGTHLAHLLIYRICGASYTAVRALDLVYLLGLLVVTVSWVRKLGWRIGIFAALAFGISYFKNQSFMLQREYLALLPVCVALGLAVTQSRYPRSFFSLGVGLCFGVAATIKPLMVVGFPLVTAFQIWRIKEDGRPTRTGGREAFAILSSGLLGFILPISAILLFLYRIGSLGDFVEIVINYWPLYGALDSGTMHVHSVWEKAKYILFAYLGFGGLSLLLVPSILGVYIALFVAQTNPFTRGVVVLVSALAVAFSLTVPVQGKFWDYHWIMFQYFVIVLASLCLTAQPSSSSNYKKAFPIAVLLITMVVFARPPGYFWSNLVGRTPHWSSPIGPPYLTAVNEISDFLKVYAGPCDRIQPLDNVGPATHGMLLAGVRPATAFLYEFQFYHHVSHPYIRELKSRFLAQIKSVRPRFVIKVEVPKPKGRDTSEHFQQLDDILANDYRLAVTSQGYCIYEVLLPVDCRPHQ
ncbi:MAG: hypothetical protein AB1473_05470 [Thermodesulfobacteriota bacterium]